MTTITKNAAPKKAAPKKAAPKKAAPKKAAPGWNPDTMLTQLLSVASKADSAAFDIIDKHALSLASLLNRERLRDALRKYPQSEQTLCKWINAAWLSLSFKRSGEDTLADACRDRKQLGDALAAMLPLFQSPGFAAGAQLSDSKLEDADALIRKLGGNGRGTDTSAVAIAMRIVRAAVASSAVAIGAGVKPIDASPAKLVKNARAEIAKGTPKAKRAPRTAKVSKPAATLEAFIRDASGPAKFAANIIKDLTAKGHAVDIDPTFAADLKEIISARFAAIVGGK